MLGFLPPAVLAANFTRGISSATKFGVHEISLTGNGGVANPYDTIATVAFTPPSGSANAVTVHAFHDGGNNWKARVYVSESGTWTWSSSSSDAGLNAKSGFFTAGDSTLRGKLKKHPVDSKAWATDDGEWFLNISDTAYYLFNSGVSNWQQFVTDDWNRGVTSLRANLAGALRQYEKQQASDGWDRIFSDGARNFPNTSAFQTNDSRMEWMLNNYPDFYIQLIVTPEPSNGWGRDESVWAGLTSAQRTRFMRYVVARYAAWPQVFWLVTNDAFHGTSFPNNNSMVNEIGNYLYNNDPWKTRNPRSSGRNRDQAFYFGSAPWVSYIHLETTTALSADQAATYAAMPMHVFNGEDWYESEKVINNDAYFFRRLFWAWILSGASANYGGYWNTIVPYESTAFTGLDDAVHIVNFFANNNVDLAGFVVADARVSGPIGVKRVKAMRKPDDSAFVMYHPHAASDGGAAALATGTASMTASSLPAGTYSLKWTRADDGMVVDSGTFFHGGGNKTLTAPWAGKDVVAYLKSADVPPPPETTVSLLANDTWDQTSFTSGARWSDGQIPHAGAAYMVDGLDLRTPGNSSSHTFQGDSLTLDNGGRLVMRTTSVGVVTVGDMYSDNGSLSLALNGAFTLAGGLTLQSGGLGVVSAASGRTLTIASQIGGVGGLTIAMASATDHTTLTNPANTYSGGTLVSAGTLRAHADHALGMGDVAVAAGAGLRLASGASHDYIDDDAIVALAGTATMTLDFTGTDVIGELSLDGGATYVASGLWGAPGSGAANTTSRLSGTGLLQVAGGDAVCVDLIASDTWDQSSFAGALHWSDGQAPQSGIEYVVDGLDLRTPGGSASHAFQGDALLLLTGGRLVMRTTSPGVITVGDLYSDGGYLSLALNSSFTLVGGLTLQSGGLGVGSLTANRTLTIASQIGGVGGLTIAMASATDHTTLTNPANTYSGGTLVSSGLLRAHADGALGSGDVAVANGASLRLAQGSAQDYIADTAALVVGSAATVELAFSGTDMIGALSLDGGSTFVAPGVWGAVGSGAANTSARLAGAGRLQVTP